MKPHLYIYKISIGAGSLVCAVRNPKVNQLSPCLQGPWNENWWPLRMSTLWGYYFLVHTMPWYKFEWSMSFYLFFYVVCYCITWITLPKVDFQSPVRQNAFLATSHPLNPHLDEKTKSGGLSLLREAGEQEKHHEEFVRLSDWSLLFLHICIILSHSSYDLVVSGVYFLAHWPWTWPRHLLWPMSCW